MYDALIDERARVRTMPLNEELGQISYLFCDKTVSQMAVMMILVIMVVLMTIVAIIRVFMVTAK